ERSKNNCLMEISFEKMHGAGNDFILINGMSQKFPKQNSELIRSLCNRRTGIGADGLIVLELCPNYDFQMIYFNADGEEGSFCGNGGRCSVLFAKEQGFFQNRYSYFLASDGLHSAEILSPGLVKLELWKPRADIQEINLPLPKEWSARSFYLDTGSPHVVIDVKIPLQEIEVALWGKRIRQLPQFLPGGTNVNFLYRNPHTIQARTYERGVEAETLSCGTGAVACALVANRYWEYPISGDGIAVAMPGGILEVSQQDSHLYLTGPVVKVFEGKIWLPITYSHTKHNFF
ncbi:MAG: diaminopimelate epimerase, partial [Bacteroidia bacterium]|nr:diaminopimelate epimerase [Bacteroidia bacterium]